jgi:hypothetical protein
MTIGALSWSSSSSSSTRDVEPSIGHGADDAFDSIRLRLRANALLLEL